MTVLTCPCPTASLASLAARLVKTVKIQETGRHAHPGQDRRLPGVVCSIQGGDHTKVVATGAPRKSCLCAGEEPEDHKCKEVEIANF